jgi:hypothetical protein
VDGVQESGWPQTDTMPHFAMFVLACHTQVFELDPSDTTNRPSYWISSSKWFLN